MSRDPCGHVKFSVRCLEASAVFYDELFLKLGGERIADNGWTTREGFGVWLAQAEQTFPAYTLGAPGIHHLCLKAQSTADVDALQRFLVDKNVTVTAPPRHYPRYTPQWYSVCFLDPDGIQLEVAYY